MWRLLLLPAESYLRNIRPPEILVEKLLCTLRDTK